MALQWMILTCVVAVEAAVAALVTLPVPRAVRGQIVALTSLFLQPLSSGIPFAAFQLLGACVAASPTPRPSACYPVSGPDLFFFPDVGADIYWKKEHRLMCTSEICTAEERIHFEKSVSD